MIKSNIKKIVLKEIKKINKEISYKDNSGDGWDEILSNRITSEIFENALTRNKKLHLIIDELRKSYKELLHRLKCINKLSTDYTTAYFKIENCKESDNYYFK